MMWRKIVVVAVADGVAEGRKKTTKKFQERTQD